MFWDLAADTWGDEERAAVTRVMKSGRYTMGPEVAAFERAFADYHGRGYAVMVNSGSSANLVGVASLFHVKERPLRRGDEVIVPAISWSTTYHPLHQYGLRLRFVDVELDTLNMDTGALMEALTTEAWYVGALGSARTTGKRLARLRALDLNESQIAKLHAPVGLPIGSKTPVEIAIAIMAQLTQLRRQA